MTRNEQIETYQKREHQVVKSNAVVLQNRYDFTVNEQKTLAYVCSMIKPTTATDRANKVPFVLEYEFEILDYLRVLGLESGGQQYNEVKTTLKGLVSKVNWLTKEDGSEVTVNWLQKAWTDKRKGKAKIRFDEDLIPHLFDLREKYLSYGLKNILLMKSGYSIRIYEMLKAHYDMKISQTDKRDKTDKSYSPRPILWSVDLDDFKRKVGADDVKSYKDYSLFRRKVLEVAEREINELTDMKVSFTPSKKGRKVTGIEFRIVAKNAVKKRMIDTINDDKLNKDYKPFEFADYEPPMENQLTVGLD